MTNKEVSYLPNLRLLCKRSGLDYNKVSSAFRLNSFIKLTDNEKKTIIKEVETDLKNIKAQMK
jgi:hypothetical protein